MTAGFQIFLADGTTVQVDDTYRNLSVREQGLASTTNSTNAGAASFVIFYRSGLTTPLIAVGGSIPVVGQQWFDTTVNMWGFIVTVGAAVGTSVPFYIFDVPFDSDPHFGIQVFNAAGQKTFDSMQKYLRVIDFYQASASELSTRQYDASRSYACIHMKPGYRISPEVGYTQLVASRTSGGAVTTGGIIVDSVHNTPTNRESSARILVADVTHY